MLTRTCLLPAVTFGQTYATDYLLGVRLFQHSILIMSLSTCLMLYFQLTSLKCSAVSGQEEKFELAGPTGKTQ
jgi:hypothetical protein